MKKCRLCQQEKPSGAEGEDANHFLETAPQYKNVCTECRSVYKGTRVKSKPIAKVVLEVPRRITPPKARGELLDVAVELRTKNYQEPALQAIYELATMPISTNPLLMQIKMSAARLLAGPMPWEQGQNQAVADTPTGLLQSLNEAYHAHSVRIKQIRERVIDFDRGPQERLVNSE